MTQPRSRIVLGSALFALSVLFSVWFHDDRHRSAALVIFTLPPLLLLVGLLFNGMVFNGAKGTNGKAAFWAGVGGLFWFSHGVMVAWGRAPERGYAWVEIALAITIVLASSWPGVSARFAKGR